MHRNNNRIRNRQRASSEPVVRTSVRDAFQNALARLGVGMPNLLEGTSYPMTRLTRNFNLLNSLYRSHWVVRRIVDTIPQDMCKNWIQITSKLAPELLDKATAEERHIQLSRNILKGLRWGRLYGGAIGLMLIKGQGDDLSQPLDLERIMPGDFVGIMVLDRWNGCYPSMTVCSDISDPEFGLPEYYYVTDPETQMNINIHHSRILRFEGLELPYWESLAEQYWGASVVEVVFDELRKRDNVSWNIAQLTFMAQMRVMKVKDLDQMLSTLDPEAVKQIYSTMEMQNWLLSNSGMQLMGAEDDFVTHQYTFSGIADVYDKFMLDVSGAAEIPVTKLFGRSPAGMNATGESDLQNYYDMIEEKQESVMRPILDKVMPVHAMSSWGFIPDDMDYKFNPVQRTTQEKLANIVQQRTAAVLDAYNAGLIGRQTALKELQQMKDETGMWSNITDDEIEEADEKPQITAGEDESDPAPTLEEAFKRKVNDADWEENKHPRGYDGKFGAGSGGSSSIDKDTRQEYNKKFQGIYTSNGVEVQSVSDHAIGRFKQRGISADEVKNILTSKESFIHDGNSSRTTCFEKNRIRVVVDNQTGRIVSVMHTGGNRK